MSESSGSDRTPRSAKGNIVLTLDEQNAARLLLHAVQALPSSDLDNAGKGYTRQDEKEKEYFAAVFEAPPGVRPCLALSRSWTDSGRRTRRI